MTFFLIVAEIERGLLLSPSAWGIGQSVDNGGLLFPQHAHLSPANRLPPTGGKRELSELGLCFSFVAIRELSERWPLSAGNSSGRSAVVAKRAS